MNEKALRVLEYDTILSRLENLAVSQPAKDLARELTPLSSHLEVEIALQETEEAVAWLAQKGAPPLYGIYPMKEDYHRAAMGGVLTPGQLMHIGDGLRVVRALQQYAKDTAQEDEESSSCPQLEGYIQSLTPNQPLERAIEKAIISPEEIADDASGALRSIRRQKVNRKESIQKQLQKMVGSATYKKYLQDAIVTLREGRYVVPVKSEHKAMINGLVHDVSASGATVFIEPTAVVNLNNELRELDVQEAQEIQRILEELSHMVGHMEGELVQNLDSLSRLDFAFAKAKLAQDMKGTLPVITKTARLDLKQARHPLLDPQKVVPVDVYLGEAFSTLIITGPNTGGKTVVLKTAGLFTVMAQSGLFIPAEEGSRVPFVREVFADIGDEQSIEQSLSTFSSHMVNIVSIMERVESGDLVLFDELGAGTDPTEGAALAMAILETLRQKGILTMATTHYSQLKVYALTTPGVKNGSMEFSVETLSPTYRLSIGLPGKSNAFAISQRLGLSTALIEQAKGYMEQENIAFEDVLEALEADKEATEKQRRMATSHQMEAEATKIALTMEREKLAKERDQILQEAREEARKILKETREESQLILDEIRSVTHALERQDATRLQQAREVLKQAEDQLARQMADGIKAVQNEKPPEALEPGDTVEILSLGYEGVVLDVNQDKKEATVQVGAMKMDVKFKGLKYQASAAKAQTERSAKRVMNLKTAGVSPEIDVRGKNIEEARQDIDKYLDDAYLSGLQSVQIIHGKGTGALREGLQPYLKKHRLVVSTRMGNFNEGGHGVTVVELKKK